MIDRQSQGPTHGLVYALMKRAGQVLCIALACGLGAGPASAATGSDAGRQPCGQALLTLAGKHVGVDGWSHAENGGLVLASACKAWPGDKSRIIAAIAWESGDPDDKGLLVALLDPARSTVIAAYSGVIPEDAAMTVGPGTLRIDTARYDLAPGVRAFGLDMATSFSQGCVDGGGGPARTLFVQDGKTIRPVLERFDVQSWRYVKGGPSCVAPAKDELIETTWHDIGIGKAVHHGFSSLRITSRSFYDGSPKPVRKPESYDMHYDGKAYRRPASGAMR